MLTATFPFSKEPAMRKATAAPAPRPSLWAQLLLTASALFAIAAIALLGTTL